MLSFTFTEEEKNKRQKGESERERVFKHALEKEQAQNGEKALEMVQ